MMCRRKDKNICSGLKQRQRTHSSADVAGLPRAVTLGIGYVRRRLGVQPHQEATGSLCLGVGANRGKDEGRDKASDG